MKKSKRLWILLAMGAFVIAFAALGMNYSAQGQTKEYLGQELSLAQLRLEQYSVVELSSQKMELEDQLAGLESAINAAKHDLHWFTSSGSINVTSTIFEIAKDCVVEITEVTSTGLSYENLENMNRSVLPLKVKAEGNLPHLIKFASALNNRYSTGLTQSVQINIPGTGEGAGEELVVELEKPSVEIQLVVYSYYGVS